MTRLAARRGPPMWVRIILAFFILLLLGVGAAFFYIQSLYSPAGGAPYTLEIKPGDTLSVVARDLEQKSIIKNSQLLRFVMKQQGTANSLKEGEYDLNGKMDINKVAATLAGPARIPIIKVIVPEGKRIKDLPAIFDKAGVNAEAIKQALNNPTLSQHTNGRQKHLEGFVFPATYEFRLKDTPEKMVSKMVERMNAEYTPERINKIKALGLDVHDWTVLASMVQAEAANTGEMPIIAGVFLNRLRINMTLGSDPTVAYGLGKDLPQLDRRAGDFKVQTPYSTYLNRGLPPTPINNPGHHALMSVVNPQRKLDDGRDALYFLHARNGKIYVNHTFKEHLRDNAQYR